MLNDDMITGRIIQRTISAKRKGKHYFNHGISSIHNLHKIIKNVMEYYSYDEIRLEMLPYGWNVKFYF